MEKNVPVLKKKLSKGLCILLFLLLVSLVDFAQGVAINRTNATANPSAGLDINFDTKGLLIPRIVLVSLTSSAPLTVHTAGMIVYNPSPNLNVTPGFYFNDGTKWVAIIPKANTAGAMQYWNGAIWVSIPAGSIGQRLQVNATGIPVWAP